MEVSYFLRGIDVLRRERQLWSLRRSRLRVLSEAFDLWIMSTSQQPFVSSSSESFDDLPPLITPASSEGERERGRGGEIESETRSESEGESSESEIDVHNMLAAPLLHAALNNMPVAHLHDLLFFPQQQRARRIFEVNFWSRMPPSRMPFVGQNATEPDFEELN